MEVRDLENSCGLNHVQYFSYFVLNRTKIISIWEVTQIRVTCKIALCGLIQYTVNKVISPDIYLNALRLK